MSSKKKNPFLNLLNEKSQRDVAIMLASMEKNLSNLTPQIKTDTAKMSEVSSHLAEAKLNVAKMEDELIAIQAKNRANNEMQKSLTSQIDQTAKYLKTIQLTSDKDAYVNRCIEYLVEHADEYVSQFYRRYCVSNPEYEFTIDYLKNNVADNEIIRISHLVHILRLYDEFENINKNFEFFDDQILFSFQTGCNSRLLGYESDSCCHKRYAYSIGNLKNIIAYNSYFNIDSQVDKAVRMTRIN